MVLPHVNQLSCLPYRPEGGLHHGFRLTDEGDNRAVGGLAGVDVEQCDTGRARYLGSNLFDGLCVAAFAEIGDALYDSSFHISSFKVGFHIKWLDFIRPFSCSA